MTTMDDYDREFQAEVERAEAALARDEADAAARETEST